MRSEPSKRKPAARATLGQRACASSPCMNFWAREREHVAVRICARKPERCTHVVVEHLDETAVDEDASRDRVEHADRKKGGARVRVVRLVHTDADSNTDRSDELSSRADEPCSRAKESRETHCEDRRHDPLLPPSRRRPHELADAASECQSLEELVKNNGAEQRNPLRATRGAEGNTDHDSEKL